MIKFEHNMLVLNSFFSEDDVDQIDAYADYVREQERKRILASIINLREQYNIDSMNLNEVRVAKYDAICTAIEVINSAEKVRR